MSCWKLSNSKLMLVRAQWLSLGCFFVRTHDQKKGPFQEARPQDIREITCNECLHVIKDRLEWKDD